MTWVAQAKEEEEHNHAFLFFFQFSFFSPSFCKNRDSFPTYWCLGIRVWPQRLAQPKSFIYFLRF